MVRFLGRFLLLLAALVLFGGVLYWVFDEPEAQETFYQSRASAANAGAIEAGTVPAWLPPGATNIRLRELASGDGHIILFDYTDSPAWIEVSPCLPVSVEKVTAPALEAPWWPPRIVPKKDEEPRFRFYECRILSTEFLALHPQQARGYVWGY